MSDLPDRLARNIVIDPVTGEWIWGGRTDQDGYGRIGRKLAHREVYRVLVGEIPAGQELDHVKAWGCTSRACCSPWCLEPVSHRENVLRGDSPAARNARKTRCDHGHRFTRANTYRWHGHRQCRACIRRRVREYQHRQRAKAAELIQVDQLSKLRPAA